MTRTITENTRQATEAQRLRAQLDAAESELQFLRTELPVQTAADTVQIVRRLEAQVEALSARPTTGPRDDSPATDPPSPQAAIRRVRDFAGKVATLNGTISSMETQLASLYSDRERLEREIGAGEVEDVIAVFRAQQAAVDSMEAQLAMLYADRERLDSALGRSEPDEIVALFQSVARLVQGAQRELGSIPAAAVSEIPAFAVAAAA
ncbi:MAG: hypothetical protein H7Z41_10140 [Cytophagales bacterium]|nr:hypothetical protein [Armatimonadota bacterium]